VSQSKAVFPQFFDANRLGRSLKEVSSDLLRVEAQDLVGRWFHANDDIDLFIWTDENKRIVKQQLTFLGQVVEWNIVEGTRTGVIIEEEGAESGGTHMDAEMIHFDQTAQPHPLGLAMDLIRNTTALSEPEQKQIIANFFKGQKFSKLGSQELAEWLRDTGPLPSLPGPSIFQRIAYLLRRLIKSLR
jgi:hypothetical protein